MDVLKDLAELLQTAGGWGLSSVLMYVIWKQQQKVDELHKELRDTMVDSVKTLSDALNTSTNVQERQVEELKEVRRALPPKRRDDDT